MASKRSLCRKKSSWRGVRTWCVDLLKTGACTTHTNRAVSWRATQFKNPELSYRHKVRTEPAVILPGPPQLPPHQVRKNSTSTSKNMQTKQETAHSKEAIASQQLMPTAASVNIQSRLPQKEKSTPPVTAICPTTSVQAYPYLDPLEVKGDSTFEDRLAEMAQHEINTIKQEEWYRSKRNLSRPSSARSMSISGSANTKSLSSSRPSSGRGTPSITSKQRRASSNSVQRSSSTGSRMSSIHGSASGIHTSQSAIELKQTDTHSKASLIQATPSNSTTNTKSLPPRTPRTYVSSTNKSNESVRQNKPNAGAPVPALKVSIEPASDSEESRGGDLNATSDLGLSIESLHLSGEEADQPQDTESNEQLDKRTDGPGAGADHLSVKPPVSFEISIKKRKKKKVSS